MKITEARLRQIIREEIAERRKYMSTANHPAFLAGHNEAMKGTPERDAMAKMPYDKETEEADLYMQGFEQGEYDFGYRMEGEEGDDALDEMYAGYGRSRRGLGARGSSYAQGHEAQVRDAIERVIGRAMLQQLKRSVPSIVTQIQNRMRDHRDSANLSDRDMLADLDKRLKAAKDATRYKDFSMIHANVFIDKVYPRANTASSRQSYRRR